MRSILENSFLYNPTFVTAQAGEVAQMTITATFTIPNTNPAAIYSISAAGAQNVILPAAPGGATSLEIKVRAAGAGTITVQDPTGPTTVLALTTGQTGTFFSVGTAWHGGVTGTA